MVRKIFKWIGIIIGCLIVIAAIFYTVVYFKTQSRINKTYEVKVDLIPIPTDSASLVRGKHFAENRGCIGCHGQNLAGFEAFMPEGSPLGSLYASNITAGKGGIQYQDEDWIRVLRHGVNKEGKSVWFMPSHEINHISNQELGELIAFMKQQPAVDKIMPAKSIKPMGRMLVYFDQFPLLPAEMIDHSKTTYKDVEVAAVTPEYGAYLATTCQGCHGKTFVGGPGHAPGDPAIPNISSTGDLGKWTETDFITAMHTGKTPSGKQLSDAMPYKFFTYTDDELKAIYAFLHQAK